MSLFKIKDCWSAKSGDSSAGAEHYTPGSLCVGNIDNSSEKTDKIAVGSLSGVLRIYNPHKPGVTPQRPETSLEYRPSDLILEVQLKEPILQILFGAFVSGNIPRGNQLAILHPRRLAVTTLTVAKGAVDHGYQFQLAPLYEHVLDRSAYNMCCGPFGGIKAKDHIAVQSVDCTITIFEHEHVLFSRFLPNSLLPGPLAYWPVSNSFLTVSSSWTIESYRFETLAVATDAKTKEESQSIKTAKRITPDWVINIGESALQIEITSLATGAASSRALVLGERNLFCVNDVGELKFSLKLDYNPIAFFVTKSTRESVSYIVANHFDSLMFYENEFLRWSAHASFTPTTFAVGNLKSLRGALVLISPTGQLSAGYLGTDPTLFSVAPPAAGRDIKWDEYDREMKLLDNKIRECSKPLGSSLSKTAGTEEEVSIKVQISKESIAALSTAKAVSKHLKIPGQVVLSLRRSEAEDVRLHILSQSPVSVDPISTKIGKIDQSSAATVKFTLTVDTSVLPSNLTVKFAASYLYKGSPRLMSANLELPVRLVSRPRAIDGIKPAVDPTAVCKVTIDSNMPPVPVVELFSEFSIDSSAPDSVTAEVVGANVSVLAAKNSNRYRVQGPSLSCCALFLAELINRLAERRGQTLTFTESFPLDDLAASIEAHLKARAELTAAENRLAAASTQIIAVEKRLLARIRDKTPAQIDDMHILLSSCQKEVNSAIEDVEKSRAIEASTGAELAASVRAFCLLIKLWRQLSDEEYAVLVAVMQPDSLGSGVDGRGGMQHGWEELVDAAIVYLLRSVLSPRGESSRDAVFNPPPLVQPTDNGEGLTKHIKMMLDRLGKGGRLVNIESNSTSSSSQSSVKLANKFPLQDLMDESSASSAMAFKSADKTDQAPPPSRAAPKKPKLFKKSPAAENNAEQQNIQQPTSFKSLPPSLGSMSFSAASSSAVVDDTTLPDLNSLPAIRPRPSHSRQNLSSNNNDNIPDLDSL